MSTTTAAAAPLTKKTAKPPNPGRVRRRRRLAQWGFIAPAVIFMALFFGYPLGRHIVMSFQDYSPSTFFTGESPFNGTDNWSKVFNDELFGKALWHTILFTIGSLIGQFCIGLG